MRIEINNVKLVKEKCVNYGSDTMLTSPKKAIDIINTLFDLENEAVENLVILGLNTKNKITSSAVLTKGTVNSSLVSPREIFQWALLNNATNIIIAHNHPSGNPSPSNEDITVTTRVLESGKMIGVNLLDHLIIGDGQYKSMKEEGYM